MRVLCGFAPFRTTKGTWLRGVACPGRAAGLPPSSENPSAEFLRDRPAPSRRFGIDRLRRNASAGKPPGEPTGPRPLGTCSRGGDPGSAFGLVRWRALPRRVLRHASPVPERTFEANAAENRSCPRQQTKEKSGSPSSVRLPTHARLREIPRGSPAGANDRPSERLGGVRFGAFSGAAGLRDRNETR